MLSSFNTGNQNWIITYRVNVQMPSKTKEQTALEIEQNLTVEKLRISWQKGFNAIKLLATQMFWYVSLKKHSKHSDNWNINCDVWEKISRKNDRLQKSL